MNSNVISLDRLKELVVGAIKVASMDENGYSVKGVCCFSCGEQTDYIDCELTISDVNNVDCFDLLCNYCSKKYENMDTIITQDNLNKGVWL